MVFQLVQLGEVYHARHARMRKTTIAIYFARHEFHVTAVTRRIRVQEIPNVFRVLDTMIQTRGIRDMRTA